MRTLLASAALLLLLSACSDPEQAPASPTTRPEVTRALDVPAFASSEDIRDIAPKPRSPDVGSRGPVPPRWFPRTPSASCAETI
jgi:hypothetical protein